MLPNIASTREAIESELQEMNPSQGWRDSLAFVLSGDPADTTQQALARDRASRDLNRNSQLARHIRAALDRLDDGSYGERARCGEPIARKCLAAVPWATLCLARQEEAEVGRQRLASRRLMGPAVVP